MQGVQYCRRALSKRCSVLALRSSGLYNDPKSMRSPQATAYLGDVIHWTSISSSNGSSENEKAAAPKCQKTSQWCSHTEGSQFHCPPVGKQECCMLCWGNAGSQLSSRQEASQNPVACLHYHSKGFGGGPIDRRYWSSHFCWGNCCAFDRWKWHRFDSCRSLRAYRILKWGRGSFTDFLPQDCCILDMPN